MLCDTCPHKNHCSSLCPEAELYVKQDEAPQREKTIGLPKYGKLPSYPSNIYLTKREKQIVTLLGQGLTNADVCQLLKMKRGTLRMALKRMKAKV